MNLSVDLLTQRQAGEGSVVSVSLLPRMGSLFCQAQHCALLQSLGACFPSLLPLPLV